MLPGRNVFTAVLLGICAILVTGCISGTELQVIEHNIAVQEFSGDITQSSATVSGTASNTGNWNIRDGKVSVSFHDYKGNVLGVISDSRPLIGPGESWTFKMVLKGKDAWNVARYSISTSNR